MKISWYENIFLTAGLFVRDPLVTGGFLPKWSITHSLDVLLDIYLNRLNKQSRRQWFRRNGAHLTSLFTIYHRCYHSWAAHDDVIKWKHFPRYWPFVRGIHRSPVNSPHKGQWRGALMFFFICTRINGWVNQDEAGDLRRHRAHFDVTLMGVVCQICEYCFNRAIMLRWYW